VARKAKTVARKTKAAKATKKKTVKKKARTPVEKIAKLTKRTVGSLRQKAMKLGIGLGHQR